MEISRRDPGMPGVENSARAALFHGNGGAAGKPLGQQAGKNRRHVLHHHNRDGKVIRNPRQDLRQGVRTAGRSADRHNFDARGGAISNLQVPDEAGASAGLPAERSRTTP